MATRVREEEEEMEERQFQTEFGYKNHKVSIQCKTLISQVKYNEPNTRILRIGWHDACHFSDAAWELLGHYIAKNTHLLEINILCGIRADGEIPLLFKELGGGIPSLETLNLNINGLSIDGIQSMAPVVMNSFNLSQIELSYSNYINTAAFEVLINSLDGKSIKKLSLNNCDIGDVSGLANCNLPQLISLDLHKNSIQNIGGVSALENYTALKTLQLSDNYIGTNGCRTIAKLLQNVDTSLQTLGLNNNDINDEGAGIIANSLQDNVKLNSLELESKNMTKLGYCTLLKLLIDISSIENTYNSNHTLTHLHVVDADEISNIGSIYNREIYKIKRYIHNITRYVNQDYDNVGKNKIIKYQLYSRDRAELAELLGVTCTLNAVFAQLDPIVLPEVLAFVGGKYSTQSDMYCALVATAPDLTSLVNKPIAIKEMVEKKKAEIASLDAEYKRKVEALTAEKERQTSALTNDISKLNEELQSLSHPGVTNSANIASENAINIANDIGRKRRREL